MGSGFYDAPQKLAWTGKDQEALDGSGLIGAAVGAAVRCGLFRTFQTFTDLVRARLV